MTQRYFDATYLGKLHWIQPGSPEVIVCAEAADELVRALHGWAEFCSIGHRKKRESLATPATVRAVSAQFQTDCASGQIRLLPLTDTIVQRVEAVFASAPSTTSPPPPSTASPKSTPTTNTYSPPPHSSDWWE